MFGPDAGQSEVYEEISQLVQVRPEIFSKANVLKYFLPVRTGRLQRLCVRLRTDWQRQDLHHGGGTRPRGGLPGRGHPQDHQADLRGEGETRGEELELHTDGKSGFLVLSFLIYGC